MRDVGIVTGSAEQAVPLVVGTDVVYIHTDIQEVPNTDPEREQASPLYQYHEIQYSKDEYILKLAQENEQLTNDLNNTQLALCDVYELVIGG